MDQSKDPFLLQGVWQFCTECPPPLYPHHCTDHLDLSDMLAVPLEAVVEGVDLHAVHPA